MERCNVTWNPGTWPFVARCVGEAGIEHEHVDANGKGPLHPALANETVVRRVIAEWNVGSKATRAMRQAEIRVMWPALANALDQLTEWEIMA